VFQLMSLCLQQTQYALSQIFAHISRYKFYVFTFYLFVCFNFLFRACRMKNFSKFTNFCFNAKKKQSEEKVFFFCCSVSEFSFLSLTLSPFFPLSSRAPTILLSNSGKAATKQKKMKIIWSTPNKFINRMSD
jgi:3-deoxy-D-manno-octulosonic-acid transferase